MIDQANELRRLVQEQGRGSSDAGPSVIAVTGGKGGVGTTTVAIQLAAALARGSDRVLLIDADPDRSDVAPLCGLPVDRSPDEPAAGRSPLAAVMRGPDGIFVLPGASRAAADEPSTGRACAGPVEAIRNAETPFDYVVVDTGNGTSHSVRRYWEAAELVLLVTTPELPSILDTYASIKTLADRHNPPPICTVVNRVDEPAVAYDVHGRLARAVWRFLGFHLDSAGYLTACATSANTDSPSPLVRQFDQLARVLRAAASPSSRRRVADCPAQENDADGGKFLESANEDLVVQGAGDGEP
jgi:flagellar biosynthesis protein FlhG